jgi:hypothetical protein
VHVNTADSIWAFELGHKAGEIAARLGVETVKFSPGSLPDGDEKVVAAAVRLPSESEQREATRIASGIEDANLRESVQKAVSLGLARGSAGHPL